MNYRDFEVGVCLVCIKNKKGSLVRNSEGLVGDVFKNNILEFLLLIGVLFSGCIVLIIYRNIYFVKFIL